jgi:hypothetical protein
MSIFYSGGAISINGIFLIFGIESMALELLIFVVFIAVVVSLAIWRPIWLKRLRGAIATVGGGSGKDLLALGRNCAVFIVRVLRLFRKP